MDGTAQHPWPSACFVSREIVQKLGYLSLPSLHRGFFDVVWFRLAESTGTAHPLYDVWIRHDNSRGDPSKSNFDPAFRVDQAVIDRDKTSYWAWQNGDGFTRDCRQVRLASLG